MNRRGFLKALFAAPLAVAAVAQAGAVARPPANTLGTAARVVQGWDNKAGQFTRLDVVYGFGALPNVSCRVQA